MGLSAKILIVAIAGWSALSACTPSEKPPLPHQVATASVSADVDDGEITAESVKRLNYEQARYHPIHFQPRIMNAKDSECLACHAEVLKPSVREQSPSGLDAKASKAWYQELSTYQGDQQTFHQRHLTSEYSQKVMKLACNFCHTGSDPREETTWLDPVANTPSMAFSMRKMVNVEETCLRCHGAFPSTIMGLTEWVDIAEGMGPQGCQTCHAQLFRTVRHQVNYLHPAEIEKLAEKDTNVCFGCHGGRQWYQTSYAYPRHPWPGMAPDKPDWAKNRLTESDARFLVGVMKATPSALPSH